MLEEDQARAYAAGDFDEPHGQFLVLLKERLTDLPSVGIAADLGCGPGDISSRFARAFGGWTIDAVDGSPAMLELGRATARTEAWGARVRFHELLLPAEPPAPGGYDLVFSNALLHHLSEPSVLWSSVKRWARHGASVFVMDLLRPPSVADARDFVARYAAGEPPVLQRDFHRSLLAAYRPDEVREQLERAALTHLELEVVSDRHFIVWGDVSRSVRS